MFISKNKFNRWQISLKQKDMTGNEIKDNVGNTIYANMNVQFKKGTEPQPMDLNKYGSYEIKEFWAIDNNGKKRKAYIMPNIYQDKQGVWVRDCKLVLGDWNFKSQDDNDEVSIWNDGEIDASKFGRTTPDPIKPEDLPFY